MTKKNKPDNSPRVYQKPKIKFDLNIRVRPDLTDKQKEILALIQHKDTKIVFLTGPAGSSKSMLSVQAGLHLLNDKKVAEMSYIRPTVESADSHLGFLPGDIAAKISPYEKVLLDKLEELLPTGDIANLYSEDRIKSEVVNYCRGASWAGKYVILDEAQDFSFNEIKTLLTRLSVFSKMVICADPSQSDLPFNKQGGFERIVSLFSDEEAKALGIYSVQLEECDIVRSELCKFLVSRFKKDHDCQLAERK